MDISESIDNRWSNASLKTLKILMERDISTENLILSVPWFPNYDRRVPIPFLLYAISRKT